MGNRWIFRDLEKLTSPSEPTSCLFLIGRLMITEPKKIGSSLAKIFGGSRNFLFVMLKHGQQVDFSRSREVDFS